MKRKLMSKNYYRKKIISNCQDILLDLHVQLDVSQEFWNVPHLAWSKFRCAWSEICICNKNGNPTLAKFCAFVLFFSLLIKKYKSKCEDILFVMFIMILVLLPFHMIKLMISHENYSGIGDKHYFINIFD